MRLVDADALKQTFCAECCHTIKCDDCDIDYHFSHSPTIDPKASGQWIRYDLLSYTLRGMAYERMERDDKDGAIALLDVADYIDMISKTIKEKTDE